jgi:NADPH:quinone reductase-like Zn-dependent oxidoreductase
MRAVVFDEFGGPEVLHVGEVDDPQLAAGQFRVPCAAGAYPFDGKVRSGAREQ